MRFIVKQQFIVWAKLAFENGKRVLIQRISTSYSYQFILVACISLFMCPSLQAFFHMSTMKFQWNNNRKAKRKCFIRHCFLLKMIDQLACLLMKSHRQSPLYLYHPNNYANVYL